jgi:hypothetical protein
LDEWGKEARRGQPALPLHRFQRWEDGCICKILHICIDPFVDNRDTLAHLAAEDTAQTCVYDCLRCDDAVHDVNAAPAPYFQLRANYYQRFSDTRTPQVLFSTTEDSLSIPAQPVETTATFPYYQQLGRVVCWADHRDRRHKISSLCS